MSGPRIKVRLGRSPVLRKIHNAWVNQGWRRKFYWHCTGCTPSQFESNGGTADTLAAAADAGRAHLAEHHAQPMTPIVQTIVLGTRCTCGDLPRNTYPYFSPCPVHSYLINSVTTTNAPTHGYCRLHGVHRSVCGCQVASVDPDALGGREKPVQRVTPLVDASTDRVHRPCDRPDCCPICATRNALQTTHNESREDV